MRKIFRLGTEEVIINSRESIVGKNNFLLFLIIAVLLFFIVKSIFGLFVTYLQVKLSSEIAVHLSKHQFSKYFSLNYNDFQNLKTADITKDIVTNSNSYVQWIILSL